MLVVQNLVGRLVEFRFPERMTAEIAADFVQKTKLLLLARKQRVVTLGDLRRTKVMPPEVAQLIIALMKHDNPLVERTAFLYSDPAYGLQIERGIREANNPNRRTFTSAALANAWLGELLDEKERARLLDFLEE